MLIAIRCRMEMNFIGTLRRLFEVQQHVSTAAGLRPLLHAVLRWQKLYIVVRNVDLADPETHSKHGESAIQCDVLETKSALFALKDEFPQSFRDSIERLAGRLADGCIVFVLRTGDAPSKRNRIVGYSICQPGVFSAFGCVRRISSDIIFGHYSEFLPEYRGRGLKAILDEKRMKYCRMHGLRSLCGVIASHNIASLKTSLRSDFRVAGALRRVSILGGLFVWQTSWKSVEKALNGNLG
jgi:L-amino acid N-acyltransferase YncA